MREVEIKYALCGREEVDALRVRLRTLGAQPRGGASSEENLLFDRRGGSITRAGGILRLRVQDEGQGAILTYKGRATSRGGVKSRDEIEVAVADAARAQDLLEALGYHALPGRRYAKLRERWTHRSVEVALDVLSFGHFCELEGPPEEIIALAKQLGLRDDQIEMASYPDLAERFLRKPKP